PGRAARLGCGGIRRPRARGRGGRPIISLSGPAKSGHPVSQHQFRTEDMNVEQVLKEFKKAGALLEGHFILSSGLHSDKFLQKALVFQDAKRTAKLCKALAAKVKKEVKDEITAIVSPAVGGIVPGYEMGRHLGLPAMYVERVDGEFQLRRNFTLKKGQKVLMVEDIVSTGVSSRECIAAIK